MLFNLTDNHLNAFELTVLISAENADKIISSFKNQYDDGMDVEELLDDICYELNIHDDDLFSNDIVRIRNKVKEYINGLY